MVGCCSMRQSWGPLGSKCVSSYLGHWWLMTDGWLGVVGYYYRTWWWSPLDSGWAIEERGVTLHRNISRTILPPSRSAVVERKQGKKETLEWLWLPRLSIRISYRTSTYNITFKFLNELKDHNRLRFLFRILVLCYKLLAVYPRVLCALLSWVSCVVWVGRDTMVCNCPLLCVLLRCYTTPGVIQIDR